MTAQQSNVTFGIHPVVTYANKIIDNLPAKTGRSIEEWVELLSTSGAESLAERKAWLRSEHGLGGTTARLIAERSLGTGLESTDPDAYLEAAAQYVEKMYAGKKAGLRPIYDALIERARELGADIKICPCKTIVPLYRDHVFAELKPSTQKRLDLGLALKGIDRPLPDRLITTGGLEKGDRITHRIGLGAVEEVDAEVEQWLRLAYELDG